MIDTSTIIEPHKNHPVFEKGSNFSDAKAAMILIHGRGATAMSIMELANQFYFEDVAYIAPQAFNNTWYPYRFIEPIEFNQPSLDSALQMVDLLVKNLLESGIEKNKIFLLGFSQGACLVLEYAARNPGNYAGIIALSGGLIGPVGKVFSYQGSFTKETTIFLGCDDNDFHIPIERVRESVDVFRKMGANVIEEIYENLGHTINDDEMELIKKLLQRKREEI